MSTENKTELLTYGYIKDIERSKFSKLIPKDIIKLTLLVVSDYYSNEAKPMRFKLYGNYNKGIYAWFSSSDLKHCKSVTFTVNLEVVDLNLMDKEEIKYEESADPVLLAAKLNDCR